VISAFLNRLGLVALTLGPALAQSGEPIYEGRSSVGPQNRTAWLERVEQARARYAAFAAQALLSIHPTLVEPGSIPSKPVKPGPAQRPTSILEDPTLRRGDVVVTPDGLMVFHGARRFPFAYEDFDPVKSPAGSRAAHAPELIELQRVHDLPKQ
jgi:hypothetical protein